MELTEKWVARFKDPNGSDKMGIANHHLALNQLVAHILSYGGTNIIITDETCRPRIIEGEVNHEQRSEVHSGTIGHSDFAEH